MFTKSTKSIYSFNFLKKKPTGSIKIYFKGFNFSFHGIFNKKFLVKKIRILKPSKEHFDPIIYIKTLQTSGYFSLIEVNNRKLSKKDHTNVFVVPNRILKKVYIFRKNHKIIPFRFLIKQLCTQMGYPKNFTHLNSALASIVKWYSDRGYQWALVQILNTEDPSSIVININEGVINTIRIEYYTSLLKKISACSFPYSIEQYLGVNVGSPININILQKKINYLKDHKLVSNIIYSIERSDNDPNSLELVFQIQELKDKELVIFGDLAVAAYHTIPIINNLASQFYEVSKYSLYLNQFKTFNSRFKQHYSQSKVNYLYKNTKELVSFLVYLFCCRNVAIYNSEAIHSFFNLAEKTLVGFNFYVRNLDLINSYCLFSVKLVHNKINFKILYFNPFLRIKKNLSMQIIFQLFNKSLFGKILPNYHLKKVHGSYFSNLTDYISWASLFRYNLTSNCSISEKFLLSQNTRNFFVFKNPLAYLLNYKTVSLITKNPDFLSQSVRLMYQQFFSLLFTLHYQSFNSLDWPIRGHLLKIQSSYLIPFQNSNFSNFNNIYNHKCLYFYKFFVKQTSNLSLPICSQNNMSHILVNIVKIQINLDKIHRKFLNCFLKIRTEYYIPINNSVRVFVFYKCLQSFELDKKQSIRFLKTIKGEYRNFFKKQNFYGFGIQMKLPINQMPPVTIEYTLNSGKHFCIYLHLSYPQ